jgi:hypothetical protein
VRHSHFAIVTSKRATRSSWRRRPLRAALVVALAIALPGAPITRTALDLCDVCPPTCPMHAKRAGGAPSAVRGCHRAPAAPIVVSADQRAHCGGRAGFARPGCGSHHRVPVVSLADAVLPGTVALARLPLVAPLLVLDPTVTARGAAPPELRPPIVVS